MRARCWATKRSRMLRFANPTRFLRFGGLADPGLLRHCGVDRLAGLWLVFAVAPADYQQGETVKIMYIHVPAAWLAMGCYTLMALSALGTLVWRHPLADVSAEGGGAAGGGIHRAVPGHRLAVGQADVGHLVGVGCPADIRAGAVPDVLRRHRAVERHRGSCPCRARRGDPDAGRLHQHADREVFGRLVEHAAPARQRAAGRAVRPSTARCSGRCW